MATTATDPVPVPVPNSNGDDTPPISSRLALRLAAAAEGFQDGTTVWFVARYEPDPNGSFGVKKPIVSEKRPAVSLEPGEGLFGPYRSEREEPSQRTPVLKIAVQVQDGEKVRTVEFDARDFDALFWSTSAIEKFAIPHYVAFEGLTRAEKLKKDFLDPKVYLMAHGPNTEYELRTLDEKGGTTGHQSMLLAI